MIGSRSTSASSIAAVVVLGRLREGGAALAQGRLGPELGAHLLDLVSDLLPLLLFGADEILERLALGAQLLVLLLDLHFLELAQVAQPHIEDGVGLHFGELERLDQDGLGLVFGADDLDDLVEVEIGDEKTAQHFEPMLDLVEAESRASQQHLAAMGQPLRERLRQADDLGNAALHQDVHVERDAAFELGELEQRLHQQLGIDRTRARLDHQPDVLGGFIARIDDERQLLVVDELGELFDQASLLHQPGNLGDDDEIGAAAGVLLVPARPHPKRAAPGRIGFGDGLRRIDDHAAGRKIGARHVFQQRAAPGIGCVDEMERRVAELGGIVRRNRRRHPDRDALRAIGQEIGEGAREHHRLLGLAIVVRTEINRVLFDAVEQQARDLGHARLGVSIGGRIIAIDIAEIALPVDQRVTGGKILSQADERIVDRLIAVGMEIAHHVADDLGGLLEGCAGVKPQQPHSVEDAPVNRLESVARIRQRAARDGGERVLEIALLQRLAQRNLFDLAVARGNHLLAHGQELMPGPPMNKR